MPFEAGNEVVWRVGAHSENGTVGHNEEVENEENCENGVSDPFVN